MEKDNVVRITRDYRLTVIAVVRSLALLGLLVLAVFSVWHYRDDFNEASIKQLVAYIRSASYSDVLFEKYETDSGLETVCQPLGVGMAVVESDFYHYVAGNGRMEFSHQLKYKAPVILAQDDWALIYDSGNTGYSVVTGYAVTKSGQTDGAIITGAVSESGNYAVVAKTSGYRSGITVYSKKHKELCSWDTPSEYIMMASLSPDGDRVVCLSVSSNGAEMVYRLTCRNVETGELIYDKKIDYNEIYSIKHTESGNLMIFSDTAVAVLNEKGKTKSEHKLAGQTLMGFSHYEQGDCLVVFKGKEINQLQAVVFDESCNEVYSETVYGSYIDCDCREGTVSVLLDSKLIWKGKSGGGAIEDINARGVISGADGVPVLIYTDSIERIEVQ
ncbi:MAG: hypothetical protein IJF14_04165 [Clostridia bacterium]|nr:hypothetical protein [Clostridia bacterium]